MKTPGAISANWLTNSALWYKLYTNWYTCGIDEPALISKECDWMEQNDFSKMLSLALIVIPDRNNDADTAMAYTDASMSNGYRISLELANGIVLQAKDDDKLGQVQRKTHAYGSKKYWAHYPLAYVNDYGRLLPNEARADLQARWLRRMNNPVVREHSLALVGVA